LIHLFMQAALAVARLRTRASRPAVTRCSCELAALPRALLAYIGKNGRRVVSAFIATAFAQDDAQAAPTQWRRVADQLRPKLPKLAAFLDDAEADVLAYMSFPSAHRAKLHSTNPLERVNGEIKRRTDVSASFPTRRQSCVWSARSCSNRTTNGRSSTPAT
jgi:putative transposase